VIGSITEQRQQFADIEKRRQQIAAEAAQPPAPALTGLMSGAAMPATGPAPIALKTAGPDIAKRRKGKRGERIGRDMREEDPAGTNAVDAVAAGMRDAHEAEAARKTFTESGATEGPARPSEPARPPGAESYDRDYLSAGHGSPSPQMEPPRENPVNAPYGPGVPVPIAMPGAPVAARVPVHVTESLCMGSPSER
jgi:hypothetical protein